jgi:putative transposase
MHEWQSLSHVRWDCKDHVVIIPKYRRKVFSGRLRRQIGTILRELCRQLSVSASLGTTITGQRVPPQRLLRESF